ncbi:hypothetical protein ACVRY7_04500 [Streptococcus ictaluri]|uniref:Isoleucyl-tRNA synthetase n=1 Tax=Streptococcus ictaluri 707-05 TaxID=764299 RepID=G5K6B5_9STRE|nr:hypothetical protein [Streptococcus ictaluri]EHI68649.1 hypothetical protein STRIC_0602 [Streptococcus ictaluri 707-05]
MKPQELFDEVKNLIAKKDFAAAKAFVEEHKAELGDYFDKAKAMVEGNDFVQDAFEKVKGFFNK